ncbi:MAG: MCE family protein [Lewinellaceae bacterium]|nr:MCE family protein [Lewinella sp.]MCB9280506.1 MCE family protein [Lewinellaceae bacterium]
MQNQAFNTVKLGIFVLTGLFLLILSLYILGKNRNLFGVGFELKTHFEEVNGLVTGNNVRYAGIDVGSVTGVDILNDTVIEVAMSIDRKMRDIIRRNAVAALGTDGLVGNRVVNISPGKGEAPFAVSGDQLASRKEVSTENMLQTLSRTNENIAVITAELREVVHRINTSAQLSELLNDRTMSADLKASAENLRRATAKASDLMSQASGTLSLAYEGEGALATLLTDTALAGDLRVAVQKISEVEESADRLVLHIDEAAKMVNENLQYGQGPANALLRDSLLTYRLHTTLENVEKGTAAFSENMEALKQNFLFRRYFRKLEKAKKKETESR